MRQSTLFILLFPLLLTLPSFAQESSPEFSQGFIEAREALNKEQWKKGERLLAELQIREPQSSHVFATSGRLKLKTGRFSSGKKDIMKAMSIDSLDPIALLGLAESYELQSDYDKALEVSEKAFFYNNEPHLFEPIVRLTSQLYLYFGRFSEAEQIILATLDTDLNSPELMQDLSFVYLKRGQDEKALNVLLDCAEIFGSDASTLNNLGHSLNQLAQYDLALEVLLKANKKLPHDPIILSNLATTYYLTNDFQRALKYTKLSQEFDESTCPVANILKARLLIDQGHCKDACTLCIQTNSHDKDRFGNPLLISIDDLECDCVKSVMR